MPEEPKTRMSIWIEKSDRTDMETICTAIGLPTNSSAIRYAIRRLARELRDKQSRRAPARSAGAEGSQEES